jgi:hypothetical protein
MEGKTMLVIIATKATMVVKVTMLIKTSRRAEVIMVTNVPR